MWGTGNVLATPYPMDLVMQLSGHTMYAVGPAGG